jgi:hypothetical protein
MKNLNMKKDKGELSAARELGPRTPGLVAVEMKWCVLVLAAWSLSLACAQKDPESMVTYEEKFITGVRKYALEEWSDAIFFIRYAVVGITKVLTKFVGCGGGE